FVYHVFMGVNFENNRIEEFRRAQNLSQRKLAKEVGTSQANLSRWEQGVNEPSIMECWKLADYFDISIDILCGRKEY
ncbi:MAG: helix-turn-helix transcriptional regulator, partial [Clostridiales bacterium]|nr:helix-turn-helix transcriptional regulator [Clostridiales bacterium]